MTLYYKYMSYTCPYICLKLGLLTYSSVIMFTYCLHNKEALLRKVS